MAWESSVDSVKARLVIGWDYEQMIRSDGVIAGFGPAESRRQMISRLDNKPLFFTHTFSTMVGVILGSHLGDSLGTLMGRHYTSDNTPHHLLVLPRPILSNQV
jgi:hypothetical protein